jgi:molecular chaperone DnaJ/curved DNA-binding protein
MRRSYYLTLGCDVDEDEVGFRHAFRDLVKHYHPDRVGSGGMPFVQEIVEAYRVLSSLERRHHYILGLRHAGEIADGEPKLLPPHPVESSNPALPVAARVFNNLEMRWPSLESVRERMLANFLRAEPPKQRPAEAIDVQVTLTPEEALAGGLVTFEAPAYYPCPMCQGSGVDENFRCAFCAGIGVIEEHESVRLAVPPMVEDDEEIDVPLRGLGLHNFYMRLHLRVVMH